MRAPGEKRVVGRGGLITVVNHQMSNSLTYIVMHGVFTDSQIQEMESSDVNWNIKHDVAVMECYASWYFYRNHYH